MKRDKTTMKVGVGVTDDGRVAILANQHKDHADIYVTPDLARWIAAELIRCANEIDRKEPAP